MRGKSRTLEKKIARVEAEIAELELSFQNPAHRNGLGIDAPAVCRPKAVTGRPLRRSGKPLGIDGLDALRMRGSDQPRNSGLCSTHHSKYYRSRRPAAQPQRRRRRNSAEQADRHHRPERIRKIQSGLRHDLCRRSTALCRIAFGLRPPVSRSAGTAGCRFHRRTFAGDFDRTKDGVAQSAIHGRNRHGNLRLSAPAVFLRSVFRTALNAANRFPNRLRIRSFAISKSLPEGERVMILAPIVRGRKGEFKKQLQALAKTGLRARPHRRGASQSRRTDRAGQEEESLDRNRRRSAADQERHRKAARSLRRTGHQAGQRHRAGRGRRRRRTPVLRKDGLRRLRRQHSGD